MYLLDVADEPLCSLCVSDLMERVETREFISKYIDNELKLTEFENHFEKYLNIYLPDCVFEINTTSRYGGKIGKRFMEGTVVARREILAGQEIKYLQGILSEVSEEETLNINDLSIIRLSSKKNKPCLMLGPLRFVNHDCNANSKFFSKLNVLKIVSTRKILMGEEITVFYSNDYFGEDNCDCLCASCERSLNGYWKLHRKLMIQRSLDLPILNNTKSQLSNTKIRPRRYTRLQNSKNKTILDFYGMKPSQDKKKTINFLNKLYNRNVRSKAKCDNCGVFTAAEPICLRCKRHQLIYKTAWPLTLQIQRS
ncbi:hypothetical protein PACTADRAFT_84228 [Pachysolen tannophilus NRRL Y-2460]|uniref:SET domain-containing protein n=1 Tax=Pachysolen tannophilus NRRL Y-2460 TaxID=669874 RepID=A0A1E4TZ55_PACTA|nr:hypothetical protein PACTADRAFT_84228 [Pachysolen tannophilus NRRL Y-2460]